MKSSHLRDPAGSPAHSGGSDLRCALKRILGASTLLPLAGALAQPVAEPVPSMVALEEVTIVGDPSQIRDLTGAAQIVGPTELERYQYSDIQRIIRQVPGVAVQLEDGFGLRPNLSIRGTASDRSSRITMLEDNVLIAPAPYAAPAAYYFPTMGRMRQVEVLKGPAAITQGPYTVGGAINFVSTLIPDEASGTVNLTTGQFNTSRLQANYGDSSEHFGWLAETHLWNSDGYQNIDQVGRETGLDKDDWMLKFRFNSDADADIYQQLDIKLQYAKENSDQSYLGLTDADFAADPYRRYAASQLDNIETRHDQLILRYTATVSDALEFRATAYSNEHERAWFKTERFDADGSLDAQSFSGTGWSSVVGSVNLGQSVAGLGPSALQAVLDGGDTLPGSIQVRNNARTYYSRGVQLGLDWTFGSRVRHSVELGLRFHEDEEDRLQRNSTYHLENGSMVLDDLGLLGNAGNRVVGAEAMAFHVYDRIEWGNWAVTPGVRYEDIDLARTRWEERPGLTTDPSSRDASNLRDVQSNAISVWIPGVGVNYELSDTLSIFGGVHKGFSAPGASPGAREEESTNFEFGLRFALGRTVGDITAFRTDYDNLLGVCTISSGVDCDIGDAFNGDAATIDGLEVSLSHDFSRSSAYALPLTLSYTYMDGRFDSNIADTDFFGDVSAGDPIPYVPDHELFVSAGIERGPVAAYLSGSFVDEVCSTAGCGQFQTTDSAFFVDLAVHYTLSDQTVLFAQVENLTEEDAIVGRQPYGARPNKHRMLSVGARFD
ncbi:MAG: TonB-dependent receptor, partial [Gammaproteobacteria bacterium]|nr:TonB-dependent receptor [Gammaproteobacteria bacterium]